jgi:hypothetical protein
VPSYHVLSAAFDATHRWLAEGVPPPTAPPIELKALPAEQAPGASPATGPAGRGAAGPRWEIVRDDLGLARGGIRLAAIAAPVARNTGDNVGNVGTTTAGERNCRLMGSSAVRCRAPRVALSDARRLRGQSTRGDREAVEDGIYREGRRRRDRS